MNKKTNREINFNKVEDCNMVADKEMLSMLKANKYRELVELMAAFPGYSITNALLIKMQNPTAKEVAKMRVWGTRGRDVKEGAIPQKVVVGVYSENYHTSEDGEIQKDGLIQKTGDTISYVYDISQTEGKDYIAFKLTPENALELYPILKDKATELFEDKIKIVEDEGLMAPEFAGTRCCGREIVLNKKLSPLDKIRGLISQMSLCLLSEKYNGSTKEGSKTYSKYLAEASAVSYAVTYNLGVPFKYLPVPKLEATEEKLEQHKRKFSFMRNIMNKVLDCVLESEREREEQLEDKESQANEYLEDLEEEKGKNFLDEEER